MIPPKGYLRRVILTLVIVTVPLLLGLLFTYDIIKINWASNMKFQISVDYQEGPRKSAPAETIKINGPSGPAGGIPDNPVPADPVSLDRGRHSLRAQLRPVPRAAGARATGRSRSSGTPRCVSRPT